MFSSNEYLLKSEEAVQRSKAYLLFSMLFSSRPDEGFIKKIREREFTVLVRDAKICDDESSKGFDLIDSFLRSINDLTDSEVAEELSVDYTRLMRGIKKDYGPPPPYESVYRDEGRVMGVSSLSVMKFYERSGYGIDLRDELPDYIATEFKFMAILCFNESEALRRKDMAEFERLFRIERDFFNAHIITWIPKFCDVMYSEARTDFYKGIAILAKSFIEKERGHF